MSRKKTVLITGAASGLGRATAEFLSSKDYIVYASDFNLEGLETLKSLDNIETLILDVTDENSISEAVKFVSENAEGLDCLINNAGVFIGGPLLETNPEDMQKIVNVNVIGMFLTTQKFFPLINKRKGKIINISSEVGRFSYPFNGPYGMSKYAVEAFSDSLRRELMFLDVKVIKIQPGAFRTNMMKETEVEYSRYIEESMFKDQVNRVWPVLKKENKRSGNPIKIAKLIDRIIKRKKPRNCYRIGNNKTRMILEYLPSSLVDFFIKHFL